MNVDMMVILALMFMAGLALGAFYFISLWQTLRKLPQTQSRAQLLIFSYLIRTGVVLTALYFLMGGHWERLAAAMVGFVLMQKILAYSLGRQKTATVISTEQAATRIGR